MLKVEARVRHGDPWWQGMMPQVPEREVERLRTSEDFALKIVGQLECGEFVGHGGDREGLTMVAGECSTHYGIPRVAGGLGGCS